MEQHAVPQDITGFKFKLVGDMTLKQFGELAGGAILAYLFFASGLHPIIKWPLVIFFAFFGVALAFLPIQERPLDVWLANFFKAIYRPTYFTWRKDAQQVSVEKPPEVKQGFVPLGTHNETLPLMAADNVGPKPTPVTPPPTPIAPLTPVAPVVQPTQPVEAQQTTMSSTPVTETPTIQPIQTPSPTPITPQTPMAPVLAPQPVPQTETQQTPQSVTPNHIETTPPVNSGVAGALSIDELLKQRQQSTNSEPPTPAMTIDDLMTQREHTTTATMEKSDSDLSLKEARLNELSEKNKEIMMKVDELRNQIYNINESGGDASKLMPQLEKLVEEKNQVYSEVGKAREEMTLQKVAPLSQPAYKEPFRDPNAVPKPKPQVVSDPMPVALTSQPNVVNGLVYDSNGVPLDGVIITIKDMQANSVRALRTSRLGNFIANTPLPSGEYYLELEKAGQVFDVWKIALDGSVLKPIQIRAKAQEVQN